MSPVPPPAHNYPGPSPSASSPTAVPLWGDPPRTGEPSGVASRFGFQPPLLLKGPEVHYPDLSPALSCRQATRQIHGEGENLPGLRGPDLNCMSHLCDKTIPIS